MNETRTLAECPDCGQHYTQGQDGLFWCPNYHPFDHEGGILAPEDIYLEHDESWTTDALGRLVIVRTEESPEED